MCVGAQTTRKLMWRAGLAYIPNSVKLQLILTDSGRKLAGMSCCQKVCTKILDYVLRLLRKPTGHTKFCEVLVYFRCHMFFILSYEKSRVYIFMRVQQLK